MFPGIQLPPFPHPFPSPHLKHKEGGLEYHGPYQPGRLLGSPATGFSIAFKELLLITGFTSVFMAGR
jgi:hypothetical protein